MTISFYDGDPNAGGILIGDASLLGVPSNGSVLASIAWSGATAGSHVVYIVSDSGNTVTETNELDNNPATPVGSVYTVDTPWHPEGDGRVSSRRGVRPDVMNLP